MLRVTDRHLGSSQPIPPEYDAVGDWVVIVKIATGPIWRLHTLVFAGIPTLSPRWKDMTVTAMPCEDESGQESDKETGETSGPGTSP